MMLHRYLEYSPKPKTKNELKTVLQKIWDNLPPQSIKSAILAVRKRLQLCIAADGRHIEHSLYLIPIHNYKTVLFRTNNLLSNITCSPYLSAVCNHFCTRMLTLLTRLCDVDSEDRK